MYNRLKYSHLGLFAAEKIFSLGAGYSRHALRMAKKIHRIFIL
jgi:hypothetical protein